MSETKFRLPWIPGLKRPNFVFYRIRFAIPTSVSPNLIYFLLFLSIFYIYIGGVYDIISENVIAFSSDKSGNPVLFYPGQDRQYIIEGIVAGLVMFMGALGLYFMHIATNEPHNTTRAMFYQSAGIFLVFMAFIILQLMFKCKVKPDSC